MLRRKQQHITALAQHLFVELDLAKELVKFRVLRMGIVADTVGLGHRRADRASFIRLGVGFDRFRLGVGIANNRLGLENALTVVIPRPCRPVRCGFARQC